MKSATSSCVGGIIFTLILPSTFRLQSVKIGAILTVVWLLCDSRALAIH